ncbi:MAG: AAA domain-containing protein, partial [Saccharothrix sp.]|nr:AAA domain-containing protein [Saccharothrix sp.]
MSTGTDSYDAIAASIRDVVLGKDRVIRLALTTLLAEGHLLVEDLPGLGKTTLALAVAHAVGGRWSRIQFTPDLLPSDITGSTVLHRGEWLFRPGGVFANVVLADEINRATPKTQSALLEAMAERQVTVESQAHPLPRPFFVVGTQNPIEAAGTYRLPESQLDRFLMRIAMAAPSRDDEVRVVEEDNRRRDRTAARVADPATVERLIAEVRSVHVHRAVLY